MPYHLVVVITVMVAAALVVRDSHLHPAVVIVPDWSSQTHVNMRGRRRVRALGAA
jgi:hypothetical protein